MMIPRVPTLRIPKSATNLLCRPLRWRNSRDTEDSDSFLRRGLRYELGTRSQARNVLSRLLSNYAYIENYQAEGITGSLEVLYYQSYRRFPSHISFHSTCFCQGDEEPVIPESMLVNSANCTKNSTGNALFSALSASVCDQTPPKPMK